MATVSTQQPRLSFENSALDPRSADKMNFFSYKIGLNIENHPVQEACQLIVILSFEGQKFIYSTLLSSRSPISISLLLINVICC